MLIEHRILFVCLGNICRSPLAEGVFRSVVAGHGAIDRFEIDSAGTGAWHVGQAPDERGQAAAAERGIDISGQRARQIAAADFDRFDLIVGMDEMNRGDLHGLARRRDLAAEKIRLFMEYAPELRVTEVPDPYYGGPEGFERVLDLIEAASRGLFVEVTGQAVG